MTAFDNNEELKEGVKTWLSSQTAEFIETDTFSRYDKCLNSGGDFVEK
jgi:hypothetical protein